MIIIAKKYYWLKLKNDFFRQKEIKKLRKIAGGDTYTVIYLKMQLLSLQNEGKLYYEGIEETFADELALELDEEVDNIKITLSYLQLHRLLETSIVDDEYILPETMSNIGREGDSAQRVRKHRQKIQQKALHCNADVTNCNTEIEKEKEIDKYIDDFEDVWKLYPRKNGKAIAQKKYPNILKNISKEEFIRCIERYCVEVKGKDKQYIQHGSTFFGGTYIDYLDSVYDGIKKEKANTKKERPYMMDFVPEEGA